MLKMDIEGGEGHALRGAKSILTQGSPIVLLATHGPVVHRECCELLMSLGYKLSPVQSSASLESTNEIIARKPVQNGSSGGLRGVA